MRAFKSILIGMVALALAVPAACAQVSTQDLQGILQALDGKEAVITLDDGSTVRISLQDEQLTARARDLVGDEVRLKVRADNRALVELQRRGEDEHFTGTIETMAAESWVVGGKTVKINDATRLEPGLAAGVNARVRFISLADGSMLATRIEMDKSGPGGGPRTQDFSGAVESTGADAWVVGGKTFKVNAATRIQEGLGKGSTVKVRLLTLPDGSMHAERIQPDRSGKIQMAKEQDKDKDKGKSGSGR